MHFIRWIAIYLLGKLIHPLNNWDLGEKDNVKQIFLSKETTQ